MYTLEELAAMLKLSRRSLYRYITDGKLAAVKVGHSWRVTEAALAEFIARGTQPGA